MKQKKKPLVTVLMTVYNAQAYLDLALESLVRQTYDRLQIIVVNDGSTDETASIIEEFKKADSRIELVALKERLGPSGASNIGLDQARGDYLARMDADDIAFLDRIEKQVALLNDNPQVVVVGGQCFLINEESEIVGEKNFPLKDREIRQSLFYLNPIAHPACMVNRTLLPKDFEYYRQDSPLAHDLELIFKLGEFGALANLPDRLLYYRQTFSSLSLKDPKKTFLDTLAVRQRALKEYSYRPDFRGWLFHLAQKLTITPLPSELIYPLFRLVRLQRVQNKYQLGIAPGWRNLVTGNLLREVWQE